jgi:predicted ArsR family transcriptional regulator
MNRSEFLKTCAGSVCGCAALSFLTAGTAVAADPPKPEDWRFQFIKQRYAKLLEYLAENAGEATTNEVLVKQGRFCASTYDLVQKHRGDVDGFIKAFAEQTKQTVTYDRESGTITAIGPETNDCFCPLIDKKYTPKSACNCSLGWNQYVFETTSGRKVRVELLQTVLRGDKRCAMKIHVTSEPA